MYTGAYNLNALTNYFCLPSLTSHECELCDMNSMFLPEFHFNW